MRQRALHDASPGGGPSISIREMSADDLEIALSWAAEEKWNPGKFDARSYLSSDEHGFLMLTVNGEPAGSISLVRFSESFAFIGLFIVKPKFRKKGYGKCLFDAALERLASISTIGLYGVPQQVGRYAKDGFVQRGSTARYSRRSAADDVSALLVPGGPGLFEAMCEYDRAVFPGVRTAWFQEMLKLPQTFAFVSLKGGVVKGFGIIRPLQEGFRVGPLYADDLESAQVLFRVLLSRIPEGSSVIFDSPETCPFIESLAEWAGLSIIPEVVTAAMHKSDGIPDLGCPDKALAVGSLEIG